jgi:hypothetical protein
MPIGKYRKEKECLNYFRMRKPTNKEKLQRTQNVFAYKRLMEKLQLGRTDGLDENPQFGLGPICWFCRGYGCIKWNECDWKSILYTDELQEPYLVDFWGEFEILKNI